MYKYTQLIYSVTLSDYKIRIEYSDTSYLLDILNIIDFYKKKSNCVIVKVLITRRISNVDWHNDITKFVKQPISILANELILKSIRGEVESTHIIDPSGTLQTQIITISTLNPYNDKPILLPRDVFKKMMIDEWASMW